MPTENKTPTVIKKNLPDELRPGVPIAGAGSEAPAVQTPTEDAKPLSPKEARHNEEKIAIGQLIFNILLFLNIYFIYDFFRKSFSAFDQMRESGISEGTVATLTKIMLFFTPLFFFIVLAVFMRLLIGCSVGKNVAGFVIFMSMFHGFVKLTYFGSNGTGIFLSALAISSFLAEAILTYDGGGFVNHCKIQLNGFYKRRLKRIFRIFRK